jgi:hypothetical protein
MKKITKEKWLKSEMYVLAFPPQVVQMFVAKAEDLVHALACTSFPKLAFLQINLELVP